MAALTNKANDCSQVFVRILGSFSHVVLFVYPFLCLSSCLATSKIISTWNEIFYSMQWTLHLDNKVYCSGINTNVLFFFNLNWIIFSLTEECQRWIVCLGEYWFNKWCLPMLNPSTYPLHPWKENDIDTRSLFISQNYFWTSVYPFSLLSDLLSPTPTPHTPLCFSSKTMAVKLDYPCWTRLPLLNFYVIDCVQWNWATTNTLTWGFHKPTSSLMRVWYVVPNTDRHCLPERLIFK